ncbi:hypothetical protein B7P43_G06484 [Cryptotermes secundus]|uniref:Uncharacterized protein n=2 Tax=Cryptotermes secundus TaxID=105785 RepID=A0A2J7QF40_9NEOP|nr:hypothetical protein B7P43_G06484 [Cryptotermes secundus]
MAQSRAQRRGVSLHKNLLVFMVLKKARCIFMEEAHHMVQSQQAGASGGGYTTSTRATTPQDHQQQDECEQNYDKGLVDLAPEEAGIGSSQHTTPHCEDASSRVKQEFIQPSASCVPCADNIPPSLSYADDKENQTPPPNHTNPASPQSEVSTYLALDQSPFRGDSVLRDRSNATSTSSPRSLKRWSTVGECKTEEADLTPEEAAIRSSQHTTVSTIPPKRVKISAACCEGDDSTTMEVNRVASLMSILRFGNLAGNVASAAADMSAATGIGKLTRSLSTPDLCSSQAKEDVRVLQQRPFRATVAQRLLHQNRAVLQT